MGFLEFIGFSVCLPGAAAGENKTSRAVREISSFVCRIPATVPGFSAVVSRNSAAVFGLAAVVVGISADAAGISESVFVMSAGDWQ